jgi:fluoride exporter
MINLLLTVGLGGALGAILRYMSGLWIANLIPDRPYLATLLVNVLGSLLIGLFYLASEYLQIKDELRLLLVVGFLGSLTTFSTFSYEFVLMINQKSYLLAISYIALNLFISGGLVYIILRFVKN